MYYFEFQSIEDKKQEAFICSIKVHYVKCFMLVRSVSDVNIS